jgi:hypothetical protein
MVNHYIKLIAAALNPSAVKYCNGIVLGKLTRADYVRMSTQMLVQYAATGEPRGPDLKIAIDTEAMAFVDNALQAMHLFLVAHEVGHFLNGDLEDEAYFSKCHWSADTSIFGAEVSHRMEFQADKIAFELVLRAFAAREPEYPARLAFDLSVTLFFNFVREISNRGSITHPRPSDRILAITKEFFGDEEANIMEKSFRDLSYLEVFQRNVAGRKVAEVLKPRVWN